MGIYRSDFIKAERKTFFDLTTVTEYRVIEF